MNVWSKEYLRGKKQSMPSAQSTCFVRLWPRLRKHQSKLEPFCSSWCQHLGTNRRAWHVFSIALLRGIFQKSGLVSCEEEIYTLENPETRENVNTAVVVGIQHILTAAFKIHKLDEIRSIDQIIDLKEAASQDLRNLSCYYCYDVHVVVGRKVWLSCIQILYLFLSF